MKKRIRNVCCLRFALVGNCRNSSKITYLWCEKAKRCSKLSQLNDRKNKLRRRLDSKWKKEKIQLEENEEEIFFASSCKLFHSVFVLRVLIQSKCFLKWLHRKRLLWALEKIEKNYFNCVLFSHFPYSFWLLPCFKS